MSVLRPECAVVRGPIVVARTRPCRREPQSVLEPTSRILWPGPTIPATPLGILFDWVRPPMYNAPVVIRLTLHVSRLTL
jgi:hypothetical protein